MSVSVSSSSNLNAIVDGLIKVFDCDLSNKIPTNNYVKFNTYKLNEGKSYADYILIQIKKNLISYNVPTKIINRISLSTKPNNNCYIYDDTFFKRADNRTVDSIMLHEFLKPFNKDNTEYNANKPLQEVNEYINYQIGTIDKRYTTANKSFSSYTYNLTYNSDYYYATVFYSYKTVIGTILRPRGMGDNIKTYGFIFGYTKPLGGFSLSNTTSKTINRLIYYFSLFNITANIITASEGSEQNQITANDVLECSICMESDGTIEDYTKTKCNHIFKTVYLKKWLEEKNECPLCRSIDPIQKETSFKVSKVFNNDITDNI